MEGLNCFILCLGHPAVEPVEQTKISHSERSGISRVYLTYHIQLGFDFGMAAVDTDGCMAGKRYGFGSGFVFV